MLLIYNSYYDVFIDIYFLILFIILYLYYKNHIYKYKYSNY